MPLGYRWLQQAVGVHKNHNSAAANHALAAKMLAEPHLDQ
jgi:hypothetical protein